MYTYTGGLTDAPPVPHYIGTTSGPPTYLPSPEAAAPQHHQMLASPLVPTVISTGPQSGSSSNTGPLRVSLSPHSRRRRYDGRVVNYSLKRFVELPGTWESEWWRCSLVASYSGHVLLTCFRGNESCNFLDAFWLRNIISRLWKWSNHSLFSGQPSRVIQFLRHPWQEIHGPEGMWNGSKDV